MKRLRKPAWLREGVWVKTPQGRVGKVITINSRNRRVIVRLPERVLDHVYGYGVLSPAPKPGTLWEHLDNDDDLEEVV